MEASIKRVNCRLISSSLTTAGAHQIILQQTIIQYDLLFYFISQFKITFILFILFLCPLKKKIILQDERNQSKFSSEYFPVIYVFVRGILSLQKKKSPYIISSINLNPSILVLGSSRSRSVAVVAAAFNVAIHSIQSDLT